MLLARFCVAILKRGVNAGRGNSYGKDRRPFLLDMLQGQKKGRDTKGLSAASVSCFHQRTRVHVCVSQLCMMLEYSKGILGFFLGGVKTQGL